MMDNLAVEAASSAHSDYLLPDHPPLRVRFLGMKDAYVEQRRLWMRRTFNHFDEFDYSEGDTSFISLAQSDFEVLVVGSDDTRRVSRILRANQGLLNRRLKIALMARSNAQRRAQVLSAGYDDAMDIGRVEPEEAVMRVRAMWARYQMRFLREAHHDLLRERIDRLAHFDKLSKRERSILSCLLERGRGPVSYFTVQQAASPDYDLITFENLKVIVCNLRKKLRDNVAIRAVPLKGYELVY